MNSSLELISKVNDYVEGRITLRGLERWLVPRLAMFLRDPDTELGQLAALVELSLAELDAGIVSQRSIRARLSRELGDNVLIFLPQPHQGIDDNFTGSTGTFPTQPITIGAVGVAGPLPSWSKELRVASG